METKMTCVKCGLPTEVISAGGVEEGLCLPCIWATLGQSITLNEENLQNLRYEVDAVLKELGIR